MVDETPTPTAEVEDFDAFWSDAAEAEKPRTTTIMGEAVELPRQLPVLFDMEARRLSRSKRPEDIYKLAGILLGAERVQRFAGNGMDLEQFMVLLAWLPRVIAGDKSASLAEIRAEVRANLQAEQEADPT